MKKKEKFIFKMPISGLQNAVSHNKELRAKKECQDNVR